MFNEKIEFQPIGILHTPFKEKQGMPVQPKFSNGTRGKLVIKPEFAPGLKDLDGFSHIYLIFYLHKASNYQLILTPFFDSEQRGVFATRTPNRPNPIGFSIVRLLSIEDNILIIADVDMLDGTPVLDIKPYTPEFTEQPELRLGWFENSTNLDGHIPLQ